MSESKTWMCLICGWIYDEAAGAPDHGIAPGTKWEDVPMNWTCPECGARKEDFEMGPDLIWLGRWAPRRRRRPAMAHVRVPFPEARSPRIVSNATGLKVLVVDDSNTIRRSAEIFLKQGGHEVLLAEDGFDALAKINDTPPDLIFCDILMPRLDGYQTCAIIKRNPRFASIPVVMLSSKDGVFDKARGRMVGSQDYLTKPFTKDQLLTAVQQIASNLSGALS